MKHSKDKVGSVKTAKETTTIHSFCFFFVCFKREIQVKT